MIFIHHFITFFHWFSHARKKFPQFTRWRHFTHPQFITYSTLKSYVPSDLIQYSFFVHLGNMFDMSYDVKWKGFCLLSCHQNVSKLRMCRDSIFPSKFSELSFKSFKVEFIQVSWMSDFVRVYVLFLQIEIHLLESWFFYKWNREKCDFLVVMEERRRICSTKCAPTNIQQCFMGNETIHINSTLASLFPLYHLLSTSHTEDKIPKTCSTFYSIEYTKSCQSTFYYSSEMEMRGIYSNLNIFLHHLISS
jgi:hypothetical protein